LARQAPIEKKLAARHLEEGGLVLYDLSSSYFEGSCCPLAAYGYNRDGKAGKLQVNWGLLTNGRGCPVAVKVFEGNTADPKTLLPQVEQVQHEFGIKELVLVGDRDDEVPLKKLSWHMSKLPRELKKTEVPKVERRLAALGSSVPIPKGIDPTQVPRKRPKPR
jgi:hypothetical protein